MRYTPFLRSLPIAAILATAPFAACSPVRAATYSFTQIDVPGAITTAASGINDSGQIVGYYYPSAGGEFGFLDIGGSLTQIDVPGSTLRKPAASTTRGRSSGSLGTRWVTASSTPAAASPNSMCPTQ